MTDTLPESITCYFDYADIPEGGPNVCVILLPSQILDLIALSRDPPPGPST